MSTDFMGYGVMLFSLPVLIGHWVGILGLGKTDRTTAWWCMCVGISCTTFGAIGTGLHMALMLSGVSSPAYSLGTASIIAASGLSGLGSLLFAIGFAIHGQQAARGTHRVTELEAIASAQTEELNRLRAVQGSVS